MATSSALTVGKLKAKTGITDSQLDLEIEEKYLNKLAGLFGNWEKYVGDPGLNLERGEKEDVRSYAFRDGNITGMMKALTIWLTRNLSVTYQDLVMIALELNDQILALDICKTELMYPLARASSPRSGLVKCYAVDVPGQLPLATPQSTMSPSLTSSPGRAVTGGQDTALQINFFEKRFMDLRMAAQDEVSDKGVTVRKFTQTLMTLPHAITQEHKHFIISNHCAFVKAESIDGIFLHLNFYLSFIDFSLLEHIVNNFGSDDLKQKMKQYSLDMIQFRKRTTVAEILPHLSGRPELPPDYVKLEMKLNYDAKTCTLEDLEQERTRLGREFSLSKFALFLLKLEESSVTMTFLLPSGLVLALKECVETKSASFFLEHRLLELSVNEEFLYPFPTVKRHPKTILGTSSSPPKAEGKTPPLPADITPSQQEIAENITYEIKSTPNSRGLAIVINFHSVLSLMKHSTLAGAFKQLKFAVFRRSRITKQELTDIIFAASHLVQYPKSSDYPIVVVVTGEVHSDVNTLRSKGDQINISDDIIEPLLPTSAPHLADNPKIFLINTSNYFGPLDTSSLNIPTRGNFIVAYSNACRDGMGRMLEYVLHDLQHKLETSRDSVEEVLTEVKHQVPLKCSMTVISHLKKPVYLHPDGPPEPTVSEPIKHFPKIWAIKPVLVASPVAHSVAPSAASQRDSGQGLSEVTSEEAKDVSTATPRHEIAERITSKIVSTRGLAIVFDMGFSRAEFSHQQVRRRMGTQPIDYFEHAFLCLKFAVYEEYDCSQERLTDVLSAASHLVQYPKSSDYPIVVAVTGEVDKDVNTINSKGDQINISRDIIEQLLPSSAPHLADNPKIFLLNTFSQHSHLDTSSLSVPSEGNFIISYINTSIDQYQDLYGDYWEVISHLCWMLRTSGGSVEAVLTEFKHQFSHQSSMTVMSRMNKPRSSMIVMSPMNEPRSSMTVISHLNKPVYLYPDSSQPVVAGSKVKKTSPETVKRYHYPGSEVIKTVPQSKE